MDLTPDMLNTAKNALQYHCLLCFVLVHVCRNCLKPILFLTCTQTKDPHVLLSIVSNAFPKTVK